MNSSDGSLSGEGVITNEKITILQVGKNGQVLKESFFFADVDLGKWKKATGEGVATNERVLKNGQILKEGQAIVPNAKKESGEGVATNDSILKNGQILKEGEAIVPNAKEELSKDCFNRKSLIADHEQMRVLAEQELENQSHASDETAINHSVSPEKDLPLTSLKEIFLPQLEIDKRHHGRVMFGSFCVRPVKISPVICSILADRSGKAVFLSITNLPRSLQQKIEARFSQGQKAAVKEPYFKVTRAGKGAIVIENPADLVLLDDSNNEIVFEEEENLEELGNIRAEGNRLFGLQKWKEAIEQYTKCIVRGSASSGDENINQCLILACSNRSEAWLQLTNYKKALDDANKALQFDPTHEKSISRRDRAQQGLGEANVPIKDTTLTKPPIRTGKDVSMGKPKKKTPPAAPGSKVKNARARPSPPIDSSVNGTESESVSPPATPLKRNSGSKTNSGRSATSKGKGIALKNSSDKRSIDRKKVLPPTPEVLPLPSTVKIELIESKGNPSTPVPVQKEKLPNSSAEPPTATNGKKLNGKKLSTSDKDKIIASPALETTGSLSSDSGCTVSRPEDSASSVTSRTKSTDTEVDNTGWTVIHRKPIHGKGVAPPATFPKAKVIPHRTSTTPWEETKAKVLPHRTTPDPSEETKAKVFPHRTTPDPSEETKAKVLPLKTSTDPSEEMTSGVNIESPNFAAWLDCIRSAADVLLPQGKLVDAIKLYDRVIEFPLPKRNREIVILSLLGSYSNRSEAWFRLGCFENSLRDANSALKVLDSYPTSIIGYKGYHLANLIRKGKALHSLEEYEKALVIFHDCLPLAATPKDKTVTDLFEKSVVACQQSCHGIYDLDDYFASGCKGPPPPCRDFVGPVVIRRVIGRGRGLFVTKDVNAGDLLLVNNPLVVSRWRINEEEEDYSRLTRKWRTSRDEGALGLSEFLNRLSNLKSEKKLYQAYTLTAGDSEEETEVPDISLFKPATIVGLNCVKPQGWENYQNPTNEARLTRLRRRVILNAIEGGLNPLDVRNNPMDDEPISCVGLWPLPSFMNHSCIPNCHMIDVGNAMFVRASRDLRKGEELTRAYFDVYQNVFNRQSLCVEWDFMCNCERCLLEKTLAAQSVIPLQDYQKLLERVQEEQVKRLQFAGRDRSLSLLLPNPRPALLQLRKFAVYFDGLLGRVQGLESKQKAWIGASHLEAYTSRFLVNMEAKQFILTTESILEFMTNTAILAVDHARSALARAAVLLRQVKNEYGHASRSYRRIENRVLHLYRTAYGEDVRSDVLLTMCNLLQDIHA